MKIKLKLRNTLETRNMTTYQLSQITGIAIPTLENWVNDRTMPRLDNYVKVAIALGLKVSDLYEVDNYDIS